MFSFAKIEIAGAIPPEEFLPIRVGFMLIASGVRVLAWLKKERKKNKIAFWLVAALLF